MVELGYPLVLVIFPVITERIASPDNLAQCLLCIQLEATDNLFDILFIHIQLLISRQIHSVCNLRTDPVQNLPVPADSVRINAACKKPVVFRIAELHAEYLVVQNPGIVPRLIRNPSRRKHIQSHRRITDSVGGILLNLHNPLQPGQFLRIAHFPIFLYPLFPFFQVEMLQHDVCNAINPFLLKLSYA